MTPKLFGLLILAAFAGLLTVATVYKYFEVRIAARWPAVPGRVLASKVVQRKTGRIGGDEKNLELRNFAEVSYEYVVQGRKYRASRVSVGEDLGNFRVEETIAKYPAGAGVMVFYNPTNPGEAVLERDAPEGIFRFMFYLIAGLIAAGVALIIGIDRINDWLRNALPSGGNSSLALFFGVMAALALLFGRAISHAASRAADWPSTWGVIEASGVENFQTIENGRAKTLKRANVVYSYQVKGNTYRSDRIAIFRFKAASNLAALVGGVAKKYPPGKPVEVFYDPGNPAEAVLDRRASGTAGALYAIGFVLIAAAARAAGVV